MSNRKVTVTLEVETNLDARALERRVENFIDPDRFESELLGNEFVTFRNTTILVEAWDGKDGPSEAPGGVADAESLRARVARHLGWTEGDAGSFSLPSVREMVTDPKLRQAIDEAIARGPGGGA